MGFIPFHRVEPELAERETHTMAVLVAQDDLPADTYALLELHCPDPACDCRRVMLKIACKQQAERGFLAAISYGFDREGEYAGPFLDPLSQQSEQAEALLQVVIDSVLNDSAYVARLERHYEMVKQAACDFGHPAYIEIQEELYPLSDPPAFSLGPRKEWIPRSAPCPCGSGKKYKQCCMWRDRRGSGQVQPRSGVQALFGHRQAVDLCSGSGFVTQRDRGCCGRVP